MANREETLLVILESIKLRSARIEKARTSRCFWGMMLLRGTVVDMLRQWVESIVLQHTDDPEIMDTVQLMLGNFVSEAALKSNVFEFQKEWVDRCILKLRGGTCCGGGGCVCEVVFIDEESHRPKPVM